MICHLSSYIISYYFSHTFTHITTFCLLYSVILHQNQPTPLRSAPQANHPRFHLRNQRGEDVMIPLMSYSIPDFLTMSANTNVFLLSCLYSYPFEAVLPTSHPRNHHRILRGECDLIPFMSYSITATIISACLMNLCCRYHHCVSYPFPLPSFFSASLYSSKPSSQPSSRPSSVPTNSPSSRPSSQPSSTPTR